MSMRGQSRPLEIGRELPHERAVKKALEKRILEQVGKTWGGNIPWVSSPFFHFFPLRVSECKSCLRAFASSRSTGSFFMRSVFVTYYKKRVFA
jgi:hypothetical protein